MAIIHFIRHGKAAAGFGDHADPGLDATGRAQAARTARYLAASLSPRTHLVSSPLARALETAEALADLWGAEISIEPRVAEIPSPTDQLHARAQWLQQIMPGHWGDLDAELIRWRDDLVTYLQSLKTDTAIFSHFIAINAAVGAAEHDDRMVVFRPDNASITRLDNSSGRLTVLDRGIEADTRVN